ncbi:hypothetical protein AB0L70_08170 [Kribbella sp. NPDC051952]|uniref:hypothetical protein n=1 Tax=Kribbella sp. NPDC051952 TaxID=3154851 RepID=UPI003415C485
MSDLQVVLGEMQPWTDSADHHPALAALLADVLPANHRTLMIGPHSRGLISVVLDRTTDATILVRSVADAEELAADFGDRLQVVAGALDGLRLSSEDGIEPFEVIVAADGLDRVLGYDSADLSWAARLDALTGLAAPEAVVVLGLENEFSLLNLLDSRPLHERHGDNEWRPLHDDPTRPVSVDQLAAALPWTAQVYADFGARTFIAAEVAADARPGELPTRLAVEALQAADIPLLSPIAEGVDSAARAGLLPSIPTAWLAITNMHAEHDLYTESGPTVLTTDRGPAGWQTNITPTTPAFTPADATSATPALTSATGASASASSASAASTAAPATPASAITSAADPSSFSSPITTLAFDGAVVPNVVPGGVSVEHLLIRLAAAEDVPGFRELASRLGEWATDSTVVLRWDDIVVDGDSFAHGVSPWVTAEPTDKADLLAAAWCRFHDRLIGGHRRHPWPPWMLGDDLVSTWMSMSGIELPEPLQATSPDTPPASAGHVARGKELAAALNDVLATHEHPAVDVRTALVDAEEAKRELFELKGHVYGLERTLGFRNKQMKTRENRIRELRGQLDKMTAAHNRIRGSRTYALSRVVFHAAQIRKPRVVARKVSRRLRRR